MHRRNVLVAVSISVPTTVPRTGMEAAAGGMSGSKRNHEDLSDMMALLEAACQVLVSPPDRSHTFRWAASAVSDRECDQAPCEWSRASRQSRAPDVRRGSRERVRHRHVGLW